ncbi:MAG TPA: DUF1028 domain-containing protein, partial [Candidatus Limnocylindrales bacterium]|nr:DUF1028 domain-containing protein [Candidatus Limnocylindrales bacterium]
PVGMMMLKQEMAPESVIAGLTGSDPMAARRQIGVVSASGQVAAYTGDGCIPYAGHSVGTGYSVQANMMTRPTVIDAMRAAYEAATGDLAARMLAALEAAQAEDGDIRGMQSAALKVVPNRLGVPEEDRFVYDLRVDEHATPVAELGRLVRMRRAQLIDKQGYAALGKGDVDQGLALWAEAREMTPRQVELAFWQAVALAEAGGIDEAAAILRPALEGDLRRAHWLDLLVRLETCGLIGRTGAAEELVKAVG